MKCNIFLIVTDIWILINVMSQLHFGCYENMSVFMATDISVFSSHLSQTPHTLIQYQNKQSYGYQIHIIGCYGNMLVSMTTHISLFTSYSSSLHLPYPNAMLKGHCRTPRKFFLSPWHRCEGNRTEVFFL